MRGLRRLLVVAGLGGLLGACALQPAAIAPTADAPPPAPPVASHFVPAPMPPPARISPAPDLWQRFAAGRHWQPCAPTPGVQRWIRRYAPKPERFGASLTPMLPAMDYVLNRAEEAGLPSEIMLVPYVESHYRADARGPGGALGMWQLMPDTARRFGLGGRGAGDDRIDVQRATGAAIRLLRLNSDAFSDRPKLMFAAYNAGAYRLRKALAGRDHESLDSLDGLGLPRVTRDYIDKLKALGCLLGEPARFGVQLPALAPDARLVALATPSAVDPIALAHAAGVPVADLRRWNLRAFARGATEPGGSLLLPRAALAATARAFAEGRLPPAQPQAPTQVVDAGGDARRIHRVSQGDSLWTISRRYRVRLADLMRWNGLSKRSVLRIGQTLQLQGGSS